MKRILLGLICTIMCAPCLVHAQADVLKFDSTVHDFGQVLLGSGAVSCTFTATNVGQRPVSLQSVTTSCGCTNVKWDHKEIAPGAKTTISATYSNDEGAYPFDKTLTVSVTGQKRPIILHLRGVSQKAIKADSELYTFSLAPGVALMDGTLKSLSVEQGGSKSEQASIANMSDRAVKISFADVSRGLSLEVRPNPVPAHAHATLYYTVSAQVDLWGRNLYYATPVVGGVKSSSVITVPAFTSTAFSNLTKEEKAKGARPIVEESTFSFGHKKAGAVVSGKFTIENRGAATLKIYKLDSDKPGFSHSPVPEIASGSKGSFSFTMDTKNLPKGEALVIVNLTTNSAMRPIVTLFIAGWID